MSVLLVIECCNERSVVVDGCGNTDVETVIERCQIRVLKRQIGTNVSIEVPLFVSNHSINRCTIH